MRELRYSRDHLWFRRDADAVTVGITEQISRALTWVTEVQLPLSGTQLRLGDELGTIESQKATFEIPAPALLEVVAVNDLLAEAPMLVRLDPYGRGWLLQVRLDSRDWATLLDDAAYREAIEAAVKGAP